MKTATGDHTILQIFACGLTNEVFRLQFSGLCQMVKSWAVAVGVDFPGLHDFREAFALEMLRNNTDLLTISRLLGHSSLVVNLRYLCQVEDDLQEGHRRGSPVGTGGLDTILKRSYQSRRHG